MKALVRRIKKLIPDADITTIVAELTQLSAENLKRLAESSYDDFMHDIRQLGTGKPLRCRQ